MDNNSILQNEAMLRKCISDDSLHLDAYNLGRLCDALATILYERGEITEAVDLYTKAYVNDYYRYNIYRDKDSKGIDNINFMLQMGYFPPNSIIARGIQQERLRISAYGERARTTAAWVAIATFVGYHIWLYAAHINGVLNNFSLVIAGGLSWGAWNWVISSFDRDFKE